MTKDINKILKIVLIICVIVLIIAISFSLIYYYAIFRPHNEKAEREAEIKLEEKELELEKEKQKKETREKEEKTAKEYLRREFLAKCLDEAYENYSKNLDEIYGKYIKQWNSECERLDLSPNSALPINIANRLDEDYDREIERMDKVYKDEKEDCFKFFDSD